jgi:hypothetical protein
MKNSSITFGADPELCLFDKRQKKIVSAIEVLKNDKKNPIDLGDGIKMYADNVLVEMAFPPCDDHKQMVARLQTAFRAAQENLGERYVLIPKASHVYDDSELNNPGAWKIGCEPTFDAYGEKMNDPGEFTNGLRTGSFHIHLGNDKLTDFNTRHRAIKLLDIIVGCASIIFNKDESSLARRKLYGKAGEFRPTPYGAEWRVLNNFALRSKELTELVLELVNYAMGIIIDGKENDFIKAVDEKLVRKAIDTENKELAEQILNTINLPAKYMARIKKNYEQDFNKAWEIA